MTEANRTAVPNNILRDERTPVSLVRNLLFTGPKQATGLLLSFLPKPWPIEGWIQITQGLLIIAKEGLPDIKIKHLSYLELNARFMFLGLCSKDSEDGDYLYQSLRTLETLFASIFPTADDAPGFPSPPPKAGEFEATWHPIIGDKIKLNELCTENFGVGLDALNEQLRDIINSIRNLDGSKIFSDENLAKQKCQTWRIRSLELMQRCWPVYLDHVWIQDIIIKADPNGKASKDPLLLAALNCISSMGPHSKIFEPALYAWLGVEPDKTPEWYDEEIETLTVRACVLDTLIFSQGLSS